MLDCVSVTGAVMVTGWLVTGLDGECWMLELDMKGGVVSGAETVKFFVPEAGLRPGPPELVAVA